MSYGIYFTLDTGSKRYNPSGSYLILPKNRGRETMGKHEAIFQPIKIGNVEIKNRVILCAMGGTSPFGHGVDTYNPEIHDYYIDRAKGNVGLFVPGVTLVKAEGKYLHDAEDVFMGPVKDLVSEIHTYGSKFFLQLGAGWGRSQGIREGLNLDEYPATSDGMPNVWNPSIKHRGMTAEEIEDMIKAFGKSALLCKRAGIDGVEIHAIHEGYLLDQFTISNMNWRTDEYGGPIENRFRFVTSIIREIKNQCGEDFPVMIRYSVTSKIRAFNQGALPGENYVEYGRSLEESPTAARILEAAGADALNADNGSYDSWYWAHPPVYMPLACNLPEVTYIKNFVNIPVFCAGRMENPDTAVEAIAGGKIDGIGVSRQFLADPQWLNKVREGKVSDIRPCIACHNGCFAISTYRKPDSKRPAGITMAHCAINPVCMEEKTYELKPAEKAKKIAVVGGGIGGMEAARLLKLRGHDVTLFEKTGELGGVFIAAAAPDFKEKDKMLIDWYKKQVSDLGIDVKLCTEATPELLLGFDEIITATGAKPRNLPVEGLSEAIASGKAMEAVEYLRGTKKAGKNTVIIGGGLTGIEIAYDLSLSGKKASVVEMLGDILCVEGLSAANSSMLREIVRFFEIKAYTSNSLCKVEDKGSGLKVYIKDGGGNINVLDADSLILSVGYVSGAPLADALKEKGMPSEKIHVIGDAREVGNLLSVIKEAYDTAYAM